MNREQMARVLAAATFVLVVAVALLLAVLQQAALAPMAGSDPVQWAERFPVQYRSFMRTAEDYGATTHGGSVPHDRLLANPFRSRAFAGSTFSIEYKAARGHYYAQVDQADSLRTRGPQPGGCINCHAAEAPALIEELGWEALHALDYDELRPRLHAGSSCSDCHAPGDMSLVITRPALLEALRSEGVDTGTLSREDLRTLVCAQCHVEYYFAGTDRLLTFPWRNGRRIEDIEAHYDAQGFSDWTHPESGAPLLKAQHPETELHGTGVHAARGVSCVDCHMPTVVEEGVRISDHWIRSPLVNLQAACMGCHRRGDAQSLEARVVGLQNATVDLLQAAEREIAALIDAIVAAQDAGVPEAVLAGARQAHRAAQFRWDFIDAENSTGFHSSLEARRVLVDAANIARTAAQALQVDAAD